MVHLSAVLSAYNDAMGRSPLPQVRGSTTPVEEQAYILRSSHSVGLIVQDAASLERLLPHISAAYTHSSVDGAANGHELGAGNGQVLGRSRGSLITAESRL